MALRSVGYARDLEQASNAGHLWHEFDSLRHEFDTWNNLVALEVGLA